MKKISSLDELIDQLKKSSTQTSQANNLFHNIFSVMNHRSFSWVKKIIDTIQNNIKNREDEQQNSDTEWQQFFYFLREYYILLKLTQPNTGIARYFFWRKPGWIFSRISNQIKKWLNKSSSDQFEIDLEKILNQQSDILQSKINDGEIPFAIISNLFNLGRSKYNFSLLKEKNRHDLRLIRDTIKELVTFISSSENYSTERKKSLLLNIISRQYSTTTQVVANALENVFDALLKTMFTTKKFKTKNKIDENSLNTINAEKIDNSNLLVVTNNENNDNYLDKIKTEFLNKLKQNYQDKFNDLIKSSEKLMRKLIDSIIFKLPLIHIFENDKAELEFINQKVAGLKTKVYKDNSPEEKSNKVKLIENDHIDLINRYLQSHQENISFLFRWRMGSDIEFHIKELVKKPILNYLEACQLLPRTVAVSDECYANLRGRLLSQYLQMDRLVENQLKEFKKLQIAIKKSSDDINKINDLENEINNNILKQTVFLQTMCNCEHKSVYIDQALTPLLGQALINCKARGDNENYQKISQEISTRNEFIKRLTNKPFSWLSPSVNNTLRDQLIDLSKYELMVTVQKKLKEFTENPLKTLNDAEKIYDQTIGKEITTLLTNDIEEFEANVQVAKPFNTYPENEKINYILDNFSELQAFLNSNLAPLKEILRNYKEEKKRLDAVKYAQEDPKLAPFYNHIFGALCSDYTSETVLSKGKLAVEISDASAIGKAVVGVAGLPVIGGLFSGIDAINRMNELKKSKKMAIIGLSNAEVEAIFRDIAAGITVRYEERLKKISTGINGIIKAADYVLKKIEAEIYEQRVARLDYTPNAALDFSYRIILNVSKPTPISFLTKFKEFFFSEYERVMLDAAPHSWPLSVFLTRGPLKYNGVVYPDIPDPNETINYDLPPRDATWPEIREHLSLLNNPNSINETSSTKYSCADEMSTMLTIRRLKEIGKEVDQHTRRLISSSYLNQASIELMDKAPSSERSILQEEASSFGNVLTKALPSIPPKPPLQNTLVEEKLRGYEI